MDDYFDNIDKEYEEKIDREIEEDYDLLTLQVYFDLKEFGVAYIDKENNEHAICQVYETLIHFILKEEYEKCAFIKQILQEFKDLCVVRLRKRIQSY